MKDNIGLRYRLIFPLLFLIVGIVTPIEERMVVRFTAPDKTILEEFPPEKYDIAAYKPGEFFDLVVTRSEYKDLLKRGFDVQITQTEDRLRKHLKMRTDRDLTGYRDYEDLIGELEQIENDYPDICKLYDIGESWGKEYSDNGNSNYDDYYHEIWALKVSDNVEVEEDEASVYYMGVHHAREPISLEVVMAVLNHILENYGVDDTITGNVNNSQIWFIPLVNPNGHRIVTEQIDLWWRKNIRDNNENGQFDTDYWYGYGIDGVDPNRNYGFQWGPVGTSDNWDSPVYHGPEPWSEPEIYAMKGLLESHHFVTGITYHSYSELVLFPFGYQYGAVAPDHDALEELATEMAVTIPAEGGGYYTPQQSLELYPCMGTTDDYSYGVHGTFSFTIELGIEFIPPAYQVDDICEDNIEAAMILLDRVNIQTLTGHITDAETGEPIVAEIFIDGIDNSGSFRYPYQSDEQFGRYYRLLQTGTYDITYSLYGYESVEMSEVVINSESQTVIDVALNPSEWVSISGTVTDANSYQPIPGAVLEIISTPLAPDTTDENGEFQFSNVATGTYDVRITAEGYTSIVQSITVTFENTIFNFQLYESNAISFESGEFGTDWVFGGDEEWVIDNSTAYDGIYSAQSGEIGEWQTSSLFLELDVTSTGEISFWKKVSCEDDPDDNWDYFSFFIDGEEVGRWDGEVDWSEEIFPVSSGTHTFEWRYRKDGYVDEGYDCAWIDYITLPPLEIPPQEITLEYNAGWNMVGLPLEVDNANYMTIFPTATENTLYSYSGNYVLETELSTGTGYWLLFDDTGTATITGQVIDELTINLTEGWNMISGISSAVSINNIDDPNEVIIPNTLYGFDNYYHLVTEIEPGRGYWIRAIADGEITISSNSSMNKIDTYFVNRTGNANRLRFENSENHKVTLYFGIPLAEMERLSYSLPPKPLSGFDIRFSGDWLYSDTSGEIEINNSNYPLTLSYTIVNEIEEDMEWFLENPVTNKVYVLIDSGEVIFNESVEELILNKVKSSPVFSELPTEFTLHQNYPNPFNAVTTIKYELPVDSYITIKIFNMRGQKITELVSRNRTAGYYEVKWDGRNMNGQSVASGVYIFSIKAGDFSSVKKMLILK